jgi:hypothetical protein
MRKAIDDVIMERQRQIHREGYSTSHDDEHADRELARAGAAYALHYVQREWVFDSTPDQYRDSTNSDLDAACFPDDWEFKPKDPRRDLVRAAALLIAEIERLDRLPPTTHEKQP